MNEIVPMLPPKRSGPSKPRLDVQAAMRTFLAPFGAEARWSTGFALAKKHDKLVGDNAFAFFDDLKSKSVEEIEAARAALIEFTRAVPVDAIEKSTEAAGDKYDESSVRLLIGMMCSGTRAKPGEEGAGYVDALVYTLATNKNSDCGFVIPCPLGPAVVAATVRDVWLEEEHRPSIKRFMEIARKHARTLRNTFSKLSDLRSAAGFAVDALERINDPTTWDEPFEC
jgi:hypothetical protein